MKLRNRLNGNQKYTCHLRRLILVCVKVLFLSVFAESFNLELDYSAISIIFIDVIFVDVYLLAIDQKYIVYCRLFRENSKHLIKENNSDT